MPTYLIELYVPRGSAVDVEPAAAPLRHLLTILVPSDEIGYCLLAAPSATSAAQWATAAGLEPERIVEATAEPDDDIVTRAKGAR